jgi:hypothetical protein
MMTRTLTQKKVFDICCKGTTLSGHGYYADIEGIDFIEEQEWENDEKCNELLNHYTEEWKKMRKENPHGTTNYAPELFVYWKTIEIK